MADIRFYHLETSTLDKALPVIVMKAHDTGKKIVIKTSDKKEIVRLNDLLWTFHSEIFLPHGAEGDKNADKQPIWITTGDENPNNAEILILTHGCTHEDIGAYGMVCEMLDARVESQITAARSRWKIYKDEGHELTYWQQDDKGKWSKSQ